MPGLQRRLAPSPAVLTLALTTVAHAFTHIYITMFAPLFPSIAADLHLSGTRQAALLITLLTVIYFGLAMVSGHLADHFNRRLLIGIGLIGNALAILLMGLTHTYIALIVLVVCAGAFGSLFHPTANALVPALLPMSPGLAIGLLGIGSGLGFFGGPQLAGWRAEAATWAPASVHRWQIPCIELGLAGLVVGAIFLVLARNPPAHQPPDQPQPISRPPSLPPAIRRLSFRLAWLMCWRDFASVGSLALLSIYLQRVFRLGLKDTGLILGLMMLMGTVVNPLAVWLSGRGPTPGRRRLQALTASLVGSGVLMALVPALPLPLLIANLVIVQTLGLAASALGDAALAERVDPALRGRVSGIFLTIVGTVAGASNWVAAAGTDAMGEAVSRPGWPWWVAFGALSASMLFATTAVPVLDRFREPDSKIAT